MDVTDSGLEKQVTDGGLEKQLVTQTESAYFKQSEQLEKEFEKYANEIKESREKGRLYTLEDKHVEYFRECKKLTDRGNFGVVYLCKFNFS